MVFRTNFNLLEQHFICQTLVRSSVNLCLSVCSVVHCCTIMRIIAPKPASIALYGLLYLIVVLALEVAALEVEALVILISCIIFVFYICLFYWRDNCDKYLK